MCLRERGGEGVGLIVEAWRLLSKYGFLFSKKEGSEGLTSPHPPGAVLSLFLQVSFQNNRHCLGERGAAEIGCYNNIYPIFKKHMLILQSVKTKQNKFPKVS